MKEQKQITLNNLALCADYVRRLKQAGCVVEDYAVQPSIQDACTTVKIPGGWQRWKVTFPAGSVKLRAPVEYDPDHPGSKKCRGEIGIRGEGQDWLFAWSEKQPRRFLRLVKADLLLM